jgi:hypothetical protein
MKLNQPRKMNARSLENLNPKARYLGKAKIKLTLKPENIEWLKRRGNASALVDRLVEYARDEHKAIVEENKQLKELVGRDRSRYVAPIADLLAGLLEKNELGESGYRSNAFGEGLKILKSLLSQLRSDRF